MALPYFFERIPLFKKFGWDSPPSEVENLTIKDLSITADIPLNDYSFKIGIGTDFSIGDIFTLENIFGYFHYQKVSPINTSYDFFIEGVFDIEEINFIASVDFSKSEQGTRLNLSAENSPETPIPIGDFINKLVRKLNTSTIEIPETIQDFKIDFISFDFITDSSAENPTQEFNFIFFGNTQINDNDLRLRVDLHAKKEASAGRPSTWTIEFSGAIVFSGYQFAVDFESNASGKMLVAYFKDQNGAFHLASLLEEIAPGEIDALIPDDLHLGLKNAFIAFYSPKATVSPPPTAKPKTTIAFGLELEIGGNLDLGEVPGIGPLLGKAAINLESMRVVGCTADMDAATLGVIDGKLQGLEIKGLASTKPDSPVTASSAATGAKAPPAFRKGVGLSAELQLPGLVVKLAHFFGQKPPKTSSTQTGERRGTEGATDKAPTSATPAAPPKNRMLQPVGQQIGPFFVESIGLAMMDGKFGLKFTGGVVMGPLVLELINFSVVSPFDRFAPSFDLDGIAIGYDKTPLTVAGLLMKVEETRPENADEMSITQYSFGFQGGISIGFKQVAITALAAYSQVKIYEPPGAFHHSFHSFFLYGYLGAPLGGPPFFFVTGLALGVGFNRGLNLPKPEDFGIFPLTAAALKPSGTALTVKDLKDMMLSLDKYIPIKEGNFWFAVGVKFESFKFLSGFLMLTVEFGDELEIGVLGIVDAIMPVGAPNPIIRINIGFTVRILPERGVVEVRGSFLPTTFILHKDVKLQGGMALLAIMKDQKDGEWAGARSGEFVFTLGGYGPFYHPKSYYPTVPALKLEWQVSDHLYISASAYFALTPEAIMLGGHFHGHFGYSSSIVRVSVDLKLGADFIIYWQPLRYLGEASAEFHLDGSIHVGKGVFSVDKSLCMDASAKMTIWGPDFSGKAHLRLHFIISFSVDVEFGAASKEIKAIDWKTFKESLLPADDKVLSMSLVGGIVQESVQRAIPTVNPHEVRLVLDTQVPVKQKKVELIMEDTKLPIEKDVIPVNDKDGHPIVANQATGIKPMGLKGDSFQSNLVFTTKYNNKASDLFKFRPIYKNVPAALWQPADVDGEIPGKSKDELIENVVCGYELFMKKPPLGVGVPIDASTFDDALVGPVVKPAQLAGTDWSEQTAFSEELIHAFQGA